MEIGPSQKELMRTLLLLLPRNSVTVLMLDSMYKPFSDKPEVKAKGQ